jgi:hypothetical protein
MGHALLAVELVARAGIHHDAAMGHRRAVPLVNNPDAVAEGMKVEFHFEKNAKR